jgi:YgjP-like, metallopeptidase domain
MGAAPLPSVPPDVDVRRSRRRLRTVTAYRESGRTVILIPARFTPAQEQEWVRRMLARLSAQDRRRRPADADLSARAVELSRRYLGGLARPASVAWAPNQNSRWGSCTPADRSIRLSARLRGMPSWVIDYVLLHELAHLVEQGHGQRFWQLLEAYPRTERARGFLEGFAAARQLDASEGGSSGEPDDVGPVDDVEPADDVEPVDDLEQLRGIERDG